MFTVLLAWIGLSNNINYESYVALAYFLDVLALCFIDEALG